MRTLCKAIGGCYTAVRRGGTVTADDTHVFQKALEAGRRGDYGKAVELLSALAAHSDMFPQALLYLGRAYHALGEYARAVRVIHSYLRLRPDSPAGYFFLGRAYLALGAYPQAMRYLSRALSLDANLSPALGLLGIACLKCRRYQRALECFSRAREIDPENRRLLNGYLNAALVCAIRLFRKGELVEAARLFSEILQYRQTSIVAHLHLASIYRDLNKGNLALFHADAASQASPEDPFLHLQKALILLALGMKKEAREESRIGAYFLKTSEDPGSTAAGIQRFLAINLFRQKRYKEAISCGTKLLRLTYSDAQIHALVAESYRDLGDLEKAKNHYLRAIENDKDSLPIRYGLTATLWQRGEHKELLSETAKILRRNAGDETGLYFRSLALSRTGAPVESVLDALRAQIKSHGPDPVLMAELGGAYARFGMPSLAEGWLQRALRVNESDPETIEILGDVYRDLREVEKEKDARRLYLTLRPRAGEARKRLVRILLDQEAYGEAAEQIAHLLADDPKSIKLRHTLAYCYRKSARYQEALLVLRDLVAESPDSEDLAKAVAYCLDKMGARKNAVTFLRARLAKKPASVSLLLVLGVLQYQDKELEAAAETFRGVLAISPRDWRANRNLGMTYRRRGMEEYAQKFLARAKECRAAEARQQ